MTKEQTITAALDQVKMSARLNNVQIPEHIMSVIELHFELCYLEGQMAQNKLAIQTLN